jgi:adenosylmethionine-8-amino-7-oxononanoate aminotransferase
MRAICDRYGILLIADEVITAFGRPGAESGSRLWNVKPDMMSIAKALTNGYFPMGAALVNEKIARVFEDSKSALATISHGYTYSGHPVGAAAALATLAEVQRQQVHLNAKARGEELLAGLHRLKQLHPIVGDARGKGLMAALELVSDPENKTPASKAAVQKLQDVAYDAGVYVRTSSANIIISPCLTINKDHVQRILDALDAGLTAAGRMAA